MGTIPEAQHLGRHSNGMGRGLSREEHTDHSAAYALSTSSMSNGGRSLYPEHLALYQAELAEERAQQS